MLASTANGIAVFMLFGAGLTAGLLGQIGEALGSRTLDQVANYRQLGAAVRGALPGGAERDHGGHDRLHAAGDRARPVRRRRGGRAAAVAVVGRCTWRWSARPRRPRSHDATCDPGPGAARATSRGSGRPARATDRTQAPACDDDRAGRRDRRRAVRRLGRGDQPDRPGGGALVPARGDPGRVRDADARRDGGRQPEHRLVRRLRAAVTRQLGRLRDRLAVLVVLGDRARDRGGGGRRDHPALVRRADLGHQPRADAPAHAHEPRVRAVLRRVRVLVRLDQGRGDHRVHLPRARLRARADRRRRRRSATSRARAGSRPRASARC